MGLRPPGALVLCVENAELVEPFASACPACQLTLENLLVSVSFCCFLSRILPSGFRARPAEHVPPEVVSAQPGSNRGYKDEQHMIRWLDRDGEAAHASFGQACDPYSPTRSPVYVESSAFYDLDIWIDRELNRSNTPRPRAMDDVDMLIFVPFIKR